MKRLQKHESFTFTLFFVLCARNYFEHCTTNFTLTFFVFFPISYETGYKIVWTYNILYITTYFTLKTLCGFFSKSYFIFWEQKSNKHKERFLCSGWTQTSDFLPNLSFSLLSSGTSQQTSRIYKKSYERFFFSFFLQR